MTTPPSFRFQFQPGETVRQGVRRLVGAWATEVGLQGARLEEEPGEAVHATRLILKRFRALVRLVRSSLGARRAKVENARLRRAARRLAAVREAVVLGRTLSSLGRELKGTEGARVRRVGRGMGMRGGGAGAGLRKAMGAAAAAAARTALALEKSAGAWMGDGWAVLEAGLRRGYRRARRRYRAAKEEGTEKAFHDWRTAVKSLMYQMEGLAPLGSRRMAREVRALDGIQDRLGDEHDLTDFLGRIEADPGWVGGAGTARRVAAKARRRRERLRREVLKAGGVVFEESPRQFLARREAEWARSRKR